MEPRKHICLSLTAHVDAGKTTLAEAILFEAGAIRTRGRVDRRNSVMDTGDFERARGITAFSKEAVFSWGNTDFSVVDTPGHADLFPEAARGLAVPDAAVLVISGSEGPQADTPELWKLLRERAVPTWIFVSKMDLPAADRPSVLRSLQASLSDRVTDFCLPGAELYEELAVRSEACLEEVLATGTLSDASVAAAIASGAVFPCFFGSGLRAEGIRPFLNALDRWSAEPPRGEAFAAFCYKVSRDPKGVRLTHVKLTGGSLSIRDPIRYLTARGEEREEKVTGIRVYTGARFEAVEHAFAGQLCCLTGLTGSSSGCRLSGQGSEPPHARSRIPEAVRRYRLMTEEKEDPVLLLRKLRELEEELPELRPEAKGPELSVCLSGRIQTELLRALLLERYGLHATLSDGRILYRETVSKTVEGMGHFEPLRHYAEVHLLLEPLPPGTGLVVESRCPEDDLDRSWQLQILDCLRTEPVPGVLTGSPITDLRISLVSGKAHPRHTEAGDFREATRRAVRHGLMQAECLLLEPVFAFRLTLPTDYLGRTVGELKQRNAAFEIDNGDPAVSRLTGALPASELGDLPEALLSYTHGLGKLSLRLDSFRPCHDCERVLEEAAYDPDRDTEWPAGSVFCSHGAGHPVPWREAADYMHLPPVHRERTEAAPAVRRPQSIDDRELEEIMLREFGPIRRPAVPVRNTAPPAASAGGETEPERPEQTLLVDGYNYIFADPALKALAAGSLDAARSKLQELLSNYAGFTGRRVILVFDGYRTAGNPGSRTPYVNIHVVYTPERETADAYLERFASRVGKNEKVCVVTGDTMIRISAMRSGVLRISPEEFRAELEDQERRLREKLDRTNLQAHRTFLASAGSIEKEEQNGLV